MPPNPPNSSSFKRPQVRGAWGPAHGCCARRLGQCQANCRPMHALAHLLRGRHCRSAAAQLAARQLRALLIPAAGVRCNPGAADPGTQPHGRQEAARAAAAGGAGARAHPAASCARPRGAVRPQWPAHWHTQPPRSAQGSHMHARTPAGAPRRPHPTHPPPRPRLHQGLADADDVDLDGLEGSDADSEGSSAGDDSGAVMRDLERQRRQLVDSQVRVRGECCMRTHRSRPHAAPARTQRQRTRSTHMRTCTRTRAGPRGVPGGPEGARAPGAGARAQGGP